MSRVEPRRMLTDRACPDDLNINDVDAARELYQSVKTLAFWRTSRRGPRYLKLGRKVLYRLGDLREFAAASVVDPADGPPRRRAVPPSQVEGEL